MASASDFAKKPHYVVEEPTSTIPRIPSKSHSNSHFKSIIIVLVLAAIPLFPSEAPSFISQSIFPQLWEIIHLLFIAIAISYGLFARKSTQIETESISSRSDGFNAYLSGLFSVNEDGLENLSAFDEKNERGSIKNRSFVVSEDGSENSGKQIPQTWNYRYLEGESMAVVDNREYLVDEVIEYKPLNLPIRSLRSRIVDNDDPQLVNRSDSYSTPSSSEDSCKNIDDKVKVQKIRGVVPKNLEKKFLEASVQPRPISWRSRSRLREMRDEMSHRLLHSRPLSVGDSEFNHIEYDSFEDSKLASSPDLSKSNIENVETKKGFKRLPVSGSRSRVAPVNAENISVTSAKTRPFSIGSSLEMNMFENSDTNLMDCGKENTDSLSSDVKISKLLSTAKSVRTFRSNGCVVGEVKKEKSSTPIKTQDQDFNGDEQCWEPNPRVANNYENRDFDDPNEKIGVKDHLDDPDEEESKEDSGSDFQTSSHSDDDGTELDDASVFEGSEVDRKAGEFIAKFREQIRLQKASSVRGYSSR